MKKYVKAIIAAVAAVGVAGSLLGFHLGYAKTTDETKTYNIDTNGNPLKVAVISDLQLPDSDSKTSHQYESFEKTLTMLKDKRMDALIIAGDFTDLSTKKAWSSFKEIYDGVMSGSSQPVPLFIMGNHDYWLNSFFSSFEIATPAKLQKRFTEYTGEYPFSHKVINGYHFICMSSSDGSYDKSYSDREWVKEQLDSAVADDPFKPIFVITHINPENTAYGSDEWGNKDITDILKDYSQVISISGHSHYSLIDERSIWQGSFTAFTTQSLDYIELESGKFNGSIPKDAYGNSLADVLPGCLYMEIEENQVTVQRLEANTGEQLKNPWVISAPFGSEESLGKYTDKRADSNKAPVLDSDIKPVVSEITDINGKTQKMISFKAAWDDDFVHSYKLEFQDKNHNLLKFAQCDYDGENINDEELISEVLYFSDFVLGLENMSETAELRLPKNLPENAEYVVITAVDSWGAESESVICPL